MGIKYVTLLTLVGEVKLAASILTGKPQQIAQMGGRWRRYAADAGCDTDQSG